MSERAIHRQICRQFAVLFAYPGQNIGITASSCVAQLQKIDSGASKPVQRFLGFVAENQISRIEEKFSDTFDLQALCHPYVGYQLCGESQQRTLFMLKLRELYQQYDFIPARELPDHLGEMLRFIGSISDQECRREIIQDALLPALEKMTRGIEVDDHPYLALVDALRCFLIETVESDNGHPSEEQQKECLA